MDFKWFSEFGRVVRFKAAFGEDVLLVSDAKAAQHILQGYRWGTSAEQRVRSCFEVGPSLVYVHGEEHKRHRRIMNPAFGPSEAKALVPIFAAAASSLTNKWKDLLSMSSEDQSEVFNIPQWASRATLDAIGHAAFDYNFGAMQNQNNRLSEAYRDLFTDMFAQPTDRFLLIGALSSYIPAPLMLRLLEYLSKNNREVRLARARMAREVGTEVAKELVSEKVGEVLDSEHGKGKKDVMSLLVKANVSSRDEKTKLSDDELYAQMLVMFIAGHETTATSLTWTLLELSRNPKIQEKLRNEINDKRRQLISEGRAELGFKAEDLESMPYLNAVVKESMRYHPAAPRIPKTAMVDDAIPLSQGVRVKAAGGKFKEVDEIPVKKGQKVFLSVAALNRDEAVFGQDAHLFRPERWLESNGTGGTGPKPTTSVGVYANMLTFGAGVRACIGWRFAVLELQTFLVELISHFEFSPTPECDRIRRESCVVMTPMIEGEKGARCLLRVKCVD
ncbi:hypothetical protein AAF712_005420 [Marasmius tenuissimus]|uniref:Cytochrome P450 n=1 Tax=Marasmius tenuissimus TaxID=585030 RepID=A0ABR3A339_9AGAR